MSVQINQYLMIGVSIPYPKDEDFYDKYESFMDDSAYKEEVRHKDGIFCLLDGMSSKFAIIGRVIAKSVDGEYLADGVALELPVSLTDLERELISASIQRNFGIEGALKTYLITKYR